MTRLKMIISLILLASPRLGAQQTGKPPSLPEIVNIPPEVAATHILKKGEPVYPAFAKAVGMQGVVRVGIRVGPDGYPTAKGVVSGWICLEQAAGDAASQYVFRPFVKNGRPVYAETSVDIVFKLPGAKEAFNPPAPPLIPMEKVDDFSKAKPPGDLSPELGKWVASYLRSSDLPQDAPHSPVAEEIPTRNSSIHLYIVTDKGECGVAGCDIQLAEQSVHGVRLLTRSGGFWGFTHARPDAVYPDVFILSGLGVSHGLSGPDVMGFSEVGGEWILLYGGTARGGVHVWR